MIATKRLNIIPLTFEQVNLYIKNDGSLEKDLNLNDTSRSISDELKEAIEQTILPSLTDKSKNYLYSTLWSIIHKELNKMVGDLCFIGEPDQNGQIEIGYGTYDDFRLQGYMTEAVAGIIDWACHQPGVKSIKAVTEKTNEASFSVLLKNGFEKIDENEAMINWRRAL